MFFIISFPLISSEPIFNKATFAVSLNRDLYKAEELNVAVSTRMCLTSAELVVDGMDLLEALKMTCLPFYPIVAGDDTERVRVIQTIQAMGE